MKECIVIWFLAAIPSIALCQEVSITTADVESVNVRVLVKSSEVARASAEETSFREFVVQVPWTGTFDVESSGSMELHLEAPGYWHPPVLLEEGLKIVLLRAGELEILSKDHELHRRELRLFLRRLGKGEGEEKVSPYEITCPPARPWKCSVPVGRLDVRLEVEEHEPIYLWDLNLLEGGDSVLGPMTFSKGASISGWVSRSEGKSSYQTEVIARPVGSPSVLNLRENRSNRLREFRSRANEKGFFQLYGLPPGKYYLHAEEEGASSPKVTVAVENQGDAFHLEGVLVLEPLATVEFALEPPHDPWGEPWVLTLSRRLGEGEGYLKWAENVVDTAGGWRIKGIPPETFIVNVADSQGSEWLVEEVDVWSGMPTEFFQIDVVPVVGKLSYGAEGIPGDVVFGTTNGVQAITMRSDDEGNFSGYLPFEGAWPIELKLGDGWVSQAAEPVEVRRLKGATQAKVEITLPETLLEGIVTESGEPAKKAFVLGVREVTEEGQGALKRRREFALKVRDGAFEIRGLSEGDFQLQAYHLDVASDWVSLHLRARVPQEVTLEMMEKVTIQGVVRTTSGSSIVGARVLAIPDVGTATGAHTGLGGAFSFQVADQVKQVSLVVVSPSHGVFFQGVSISKELESKLQLVMAGEVGDLVIPDPTGQLMLFNHGVGIPLRRILGLLSSLGKVSPHPAEGLLLKGFTIGSWSLCLGPHFVESACDTRDLFPNTEIRFGLPKRENNEGDASLP